MIRSERISSLGKFGLESEINVVKVRGGTGVTKIKIDFPTENYRGVKYMSHYPSCIYYNFRIARNNPDNFQHILNKVQ